MIRGPRQPGRPTAEPSPDHGSTPTLILQTLDGAEGLRGWQWLFVIEGIPSVLLGLALLRLLPDGRPSDRRLSIVW